MAISSWLCSNSKNMVVKIVHQGGHVELFDRPVLANEILVRNPKCHVAYPTVFKQPWAVVSPETILTPGQKFYVVPTNTIKKLQKLALRNSPNLFLEMQAIQSYENQVGYVKEEAFCCWNSTDDKTKKGKHRANKAYDKSCFGNLISATKIRNEHPSSETNSSSSSGSSSGNKTENSPKRNVSFDSWQPCLESIVEE